MFRAAPAFRFAGIAIALLSVVSPVQAQSGDIQADQVRDVFRKYCIECHGGGKALRGDVNVLNPFSLTPHNRPLVKPFKPNESELLQLVECGTMPPGTRPKVPEKERKLLREWITAGALAFPLESSDQYAMTKILRDVRAAATDQGRSLADERYLTLNHLLADEDTAAALNLYRAALNKAINQLSMSKSHVAITPIDPAATIYRIKLTALGWDARPFIAEEQKKKVGQVIDPTSVNLYDVLLLDYPLASLPPRSEIADALVSEYLGRANLLRPILYIRGDWLASVATQAPLYNDMVRLPLWMHELDQRLDLGQDIKRARAAFTNSGEVRDNRLVERRSTSKGWLWRTYDLNGKRGPDALVDDAGAANPGGGEVIFRLPNGLPGYFIADGRGGRLDSNPAAKDEARNGLSCMICHERGLIKVKNEWGNDLPDRVKQTMLYPGDDEFGRLLEKDNADLAAALRQTLFGLAEVEPLGPVSRRFLQEKKPAAPESKVRFINFDAHPRKQALDRARVAFVERDVPFRVQARGGPPPVPMLPIDAIGLQRVAAKDAPVLFELMTVRVDSGTDKPMNAFRPGEKMAIVVKNKSGADLHYELAITDDKGRGEIGNLLQDRVLKPGATLRLPPTGGTGITAPKEGELTKQRVTVFAAVEKFPAGIVLNPSDKLAPGEGVAARLVHPLYRLNGKTVETAFDPAKMVRQTIEFETVAK